MHSACCPSLPEHMKVRVCALDELPCYTGIDRYEYTTNEWETSEEYEGSSEELVDGRSAGSTNSNSSLSNQDKDSIEENDDEQTDWRELDERSSSIQNSTPGLEHSYIIIDSPAERSSSIQSGSFHVADKKEIHELDDEFGGKQRGQQANRLCSTKTDAYHDPLATGLPSEVEVIDVFTPPCSKVRADNKRRLSASCPEIIDLTDSPIYV